MGQEFIIKSQKLEDKVNQLLPSQGGFQAGVDLSASTTVIPIVDLTETAEGSEVRQDLQTAISFSNATEFNISNATTTIITTTGYYRIFGGITCLWNSSSSEAFNVYISDGASNKIIYGLGKPTSTADTFIDSFDEIIFLKAGDSVLVECSANTRFRGSTRQIADISGNLVDPA